MPLTAPQNELEAVRLVDGSLTFPINSHKTGEIRRLREGLKPKTVQKNPGQNRDDPIGAGTRVQSQGLKPRVNRG